MAKHRLRRLQLMEVAMVSDGDNGPAAVVFAKSRQPAKDVTPAPEVPTLVDVAATVEPTGIEKNKESDMTFKIDTIPVEFRKAVQDALDAAGVEAVAKSKAAPPVEPVAALPVDIQKKLDVQSAEIDFLKKRVQESEVATEIAKCKAAYPDVPDVEDIAKALYRLDSEGDPSAAVFRKNLAAMQAQLALGDKVATQTHGKDGAFSKAKDAEKKLEAIAKSKMAADPSMPFSKALSETYRENRALYAQYSRSNTPTIADDGDDGDSENVDD